MTAERRSNDNHATPEQLDYLSWYLGGESEYPCYETDAFGRVMHAGYSLEVSLDAMLSGQDDDDDDLATSMKPVERGNVPSPEDALATYFGDERLAMLSKRERQVFILRNVCAMYPREVAEHLGIGVERVKNCLHRSRTKLSK